MTRKDAAAVLALAVGVVAHATIGAVAHGAESITLTGDKITLAEGTVTSDGPVEIAWGVHQIRAASCRYDVKAQRLVLGSGTWTGASGTGRFEAAHLDMESHKAALDGVAYTGVDGAPRVAAASLVLTREGKVRGQEVMFTPCGCARAPWSVSARRVLADPDSRASFSGGMGRICGVPVLPIPAGIIPLKPRAAGFLPPRIGISQGGTVVAQPFFTPIGRAADATVTPEWRQTGLGRVLNEVRLQPRNGPLSVVQSGVGRDSLHGVDRGFVDVQHATSTGLSRVAIDGTWTSDRRYLSDYGDDFLTRSAPWTETLAVAGVGPVRLESDTFQAESMVGQRPIAGVFSVGAVPMGPVSGDAMVRLDAVHAGTEPWQSQDRAQRFAAASAVGGGDHFGPIQMEARAEGRVIGWSGHDPWQEGRLGGAVRLPLWADVGAWRHLADVGLTGQAAFLAGTPIVRLPEDEPSPAFGLGPELRSQWLVSDGVPVSLAMAAPWTDDGWDPVGGGRAQLGDWGVRAMAGRTLQEGGTWWDDERVRLGLGLAHYQSLVQSTGEFAWTLPAPVDELRPGYSVLRDLRGDAWLRHGPTLVFQSKCDCLQLSAAVEWAADRDIPDAMLRLDLR